MELIGGSKDGGGLRGRSLNRELWGKGGRAVVVMKMEGCGGKGGKGGREL